MLKFWKGKQKKTVKSENAKGMKHYERALHALHRGDICKYVEELDKGYAHFERALKLHIKKERKRGKKGKAVRPFVCPNGVTVKFS